MNRRLFALLLTGYAGCPLHAVPVDESRGKPVSAAAEASPEKPSSAQPVKLRIDQAQSRLRSNPEAAKAELRTIRAELESTQKTGHDEASAHFQLGRVLLLLEDTPQALTHLRRAVELAPSESAHHHMLGLALLYSRDREQATAEIAKACELKPDDARCLEDLAELLSAAKKSLQAEQTVRRALTLKPKDPRLWILLAETLLDQKKQDDGALAYQEAIRLEPSSILAYHNLGQIYQLQNKTKESLAAFQKVVELDPEDWRAHAKLVQLHQARGDLPARDAERMRLYDLYKAGRISQGYFCREQLSAGKHKFISFENFELKGAFAIKYTFQLLDDAGGETSARFSLGSYELTNQYVHQAEGLSPDIRVYHLDYYEKSEGQNKHSTFGFYKGEPSYDLIRQQVLSIQENGTKPVSSSSGIPSLPSSVNP